MGDKHSRPARNSSAAQPAPTPAESSKGASKAVTTPPPEPEKVDVLISSTSCQQDVALATLIKDGLEKASIPVYIHSEATDQSAKVAGKLLVDAKCFVYIASKEAAENNSGQDLISLAYISNKHIMVAAETPKDDLIKAFVVGMKMTLHQLLWTIFDVDPQVEGFIQKIQEKLSEAEETAVTSSVFTRRGGRLNTKLRTQTTLQDISIGTEQSRIGSFWDRNFESDDEVPWYKFQKCFLDDYETQLSKSFEEDNIPWLLDLLKNDVLEVKGEKVTKAQFIRVRGDSEERNAFWKVVSAIAVEKFNMKEVFDMNSTVRLTAIEKLATFQNQAVVEALMVLLDDGDPNVRAVAAISLGRTGCTDAKVVDKLIELLKDGDRIVRQSACLSLGAMKAVKAIPNIGNIWRNDFISVVRNAARTALENMKIPEAEEVLKVTKVLEEEIAALEGNQAAV